MPAQASERRDAPPHSDGSLGAEAWTTAANACMRACAQTRRRTATTRLPGVTLSNKVLTSGHHARTSLPGPSKLSNKPAPALPTSRRELQELEDRLIVSHRSLQEFEFLSTARVNDLYMRHRSLPETLTVDQRALVAAVLCLGRMSEIAFHDKNGTVTLGAISPHESREDITYYKLTMQYLEQFGSSSCTALCALHCLQLYVQILGGPEENRDVLGAMSWHARELGLHRRETASAYPSQDKAAHLFFSTLYKDT